MRKKSFHRRKSKTNASIAVNIYGMTYLLYYLYILYFEFPRILPIPLKVFCINIIRIRTIDLFFNFSATSIIKR